MRVQERARILVSRDEAVATLEACIGIMLTKLSGMAARIGGHDLQLRRKVEQIVYETRKEIADEANKQADANGEPPEEIEA